MKTKEEIKKYVKDNARVHKSNGDIYHSCPYIDELILFFENSVTNIGSDLFGILVTKLETIRKINETLRAKADANDNNNDMINTYERVIKDLKFATNVYGNRSRDGESIVEDAIDEIEELRQKVEKLEQQLNKYKKKCIMKELKYTKNSKFEIIFENLDEVKEDNKAILRLNNGDITPLIKAYNKTTASFGFYIPYLADISLVSETFFNISFGTYSMINCSVFDCYNEDKIKNILPKWNIPEDNAVLFLTEEDSVRYYKICLNNNRIGLSYIKETYPRTKNEYNKISIIIPELHAEGDPSQLELYPHLYCHIDNINKICKELKEKYGVERIELFVSHCFLQIDDTSLFCCQENGKMCMRYETFNDWSIEPPFMYLNFDFLTITNSTQNICTYNQCDRDAANEFYKKENKNYESRIEVVDVVEFFKD